MTAAERTQIVAETLRFLADDWVGATDDDRQWLRDVAETLEAGLDDAGCPLCAEIICDDGCPLEPAREAARQAD